MQAVNLAGGLATRMRPRTLTTPKFLLPVANRPFGAFLLERLASAGYDAVVLCVAHLGEQIREFVGDGARFGLSVRYADEGPNLLGTAGAIRAALADLALAVRRRSRRRLRVGRRRRGLVRRIRSDRDARAFAGHGCPLRRHVGIG